nr:TAXI family TRAP transporter solute-binding subunit [Alkalicoccus halolimnae]
MSGAVILAGAAALSACGNEGSNGGETNSDAEANSNTEAANGNADTEEATNEVQEDGGGEATGEDAPEGAPENINLGSASQGGTYYVYAGGVATMIDQNLDVPVNVEVTGGPVHNMQLVQSGDLNLGFATLGPAYEGYTGTGDWAEEPLDDVRIAFPMYTTPFKWWALEDSGIESMEDIEGQRVGVGPSGGTSGTYYPIIHESLELNTEDVQTGANDMASQMLDGQLDVIAFAAGTPISILTEIETQRDVNIFGLEGEMREEILDMYPYFYEHTVPGGSYESLPDDMETIAVYNFGIVHKDMDADFVYELVKSYHENNDQLVSTHASAEEATEDAILNNEQVPLHEGAIRYYEEAGIELPEDVYVD